MAQAVKCTIDNMAAAITLAISEVEPAAMNAQRAAIDRAAKETAEKVRKNAQATFTQHTGDYAKSWKQKVDSDAKKAGEYSRVVYADDRGAWLAHLLENGHAKVNGGRVPGRPHIRPAADEAAEKLPRYIREELAKRI